MKVLLTGANGFVGSNIARYFLKKGYQVSVISRTPESMLRLEEIRDSLDVHKGDVTNRENISSIINEVKPDGVINSAIYGGYPFQRDTDRIVRTNFDGSRYLIDEAVKTGIDWFINLGSSSEYGFKSHPMTETDMLEPIDEYGVAKAASTLYCSAMAKRNNVPFTTLRLFSVYGPFEENTRLIPHLILSLLNGTKPKLSSPRPVRDFIHVEDVCRACEKAITNSERIPPGSVFNVGTGVKTSVGEVVEKLSEIMGGELKVEWGENPGRPSDENVNWVADTEHAKNSLDWNSELDLKKGLKETIDWFASNKKIYGKKYDDRTRQN